jgi:hypothetical protein
VANYAYLNKPVNIAVGKKAPKVYLGDVTTAILQAEESQYTTIKSMDELYANLMRIAFHAMLFLWMQQIILDF